MEAPAGNDPASTSFADLCHRLMDGATLKSEMGEQFDDRLGVGQPTSPAFLQGRDSNPRPISEVSVIYATQRSVRGYSRKDSFLAVALPTELQSSFRTTGGN